MKKTVSFFLSFVLLLSAVFCVPGFSASAAVYKPDRKLYSQAYMLLSLDDPSFPVVAEKNQDKRMYPASLTKIVTTMVVLNKVKDLSQKTKVSQSAYDAVLGTGAQTAGLKVGESLTIEQLLYLTMVHSACDACHVLAEFVSGSTDAFVAEMNSWVQSLGCKNTHFVNPDGLHDPNHYSTAWDIYLFTREAMKNETFMKICGTASYVVPATNMSEERELYTTNSLISNWRIMGYQYDGADGIKTGSTEESGYCLVSSAKRSGRRLVAVVLGCKGNGATVESFSESAKLYNWAYNNFSMRQVAATDELYRQPVALSKQTDTVMLYPAQSVEAFLPKDAKDEDIRKSVTLKQDVVNAPITAGQELGTLTITYNDQVCAEVPLLAQADVSASRFLVAKAAVEAFFAKTWVKLALVAVVVLVIVFILWLKLGRRSRRYGSRGGKRRQRRAYRGRRRW